MLTSQSARPANTDLAFFSKSKRSKEAAPVSTNVIVTTRSAKPVVRQTTTARKRKESTLISAALPREVKRLRPSPSISSGSSNPESHTKRASTSVSTSATRLSTPEPIYRSSRSRSTSAFPAGTTNVVQVERQCWIEEDGCPGEGAVTSEIVVRDLIKTYKQCERDLSASAMLSFTCFCQTSLIWMTQMTEVGNFIRLIIRGLN